MIQILCAQTLENCRTFGIRDRNYSLFRSGIDSSICKIRHKHCKKSLKPSASKLCRLLKTINWYSFSRMSLRIFVTHLASMRPKMLKLRISLQSAVPNSSPKISNLAQHKRHWRFRILKSFCRKLLHRYRFHQIGDFTVGVPTRSSCSSEMQEAFKQSSPSCRLSLSPFTPMACTRDPLLLTTLFAGLRLSARGNH